MMSMVVSNEPNGPQVARETVQGSVCLHQENWDPRLSLIVLRLGPTWLMHLANRWERWADRAPVSLGSCFPRPRSKRSGGSRAGRRTWRVEESRGV